MKRLVLSACVLGTLGAWCGALMAQEVEMLATDTKCINPAGQNWNDNRLRAYFSDGISHVDGFMKFDFSGIPDGASITGMVLTTYHEEGFGNPLNDPQVRIYRVANDAWQRGNNDAHPGLNEVLTDVHAGFPSGNLVPYDWELDVNAADWRQDLDDDMLSLGMSNVKESYSYVYWHGSDPQPAPPKLKVTFTTGSHCLYKVKSSKAQGGCQFCPAKNSVYRSEQECNDVNECPKKVKTTIGCPQGPGVCKIKAKNRQCA